MQLGAFSSIVRRLSICENLPTVIPGRTHQRVYARLRRAMGRELGIQKPALSVWIPASALRARIDVAANLTARITLRPKFRGTIFWSAASCAIASSAFRFGSIPNDIGMFLRRNLMATEAFQLIKDDFDELYRSGGWMAGS